MFKSLRGLHMLQCYLEVETEAERDCNGLFFFWSSKHSDDFVAGERILILCLCQSYLAIVLIIFALEAARMK